MCVTTGLAAIDSTRVFTLVTDSIQGGQTVHVTGYQNEATNLSGVPNCMLLHFPCFGVPELVDGPQWTTTLMNDITRDLPEVEHHPKTRGMMSFGAAEVHKYGDYDIVLAGDPSDITSVIEGVAEDRRPAITKSFEQMIDWYGEHFTDYGFVLGCFNGRVNPRHPIVVSYVPHSDDDVFAPGLDGHDGRLPVIGAPVFRDFKVAFGKTGVDLPIKVQHNRDAEGAWWAPDSINGFHDNRFNGPNTDFVVAIDDLSVGLPGADLLNHCY